MFGCGRTSDQADCPHELRPARSAQALRRVRQGLHASGRGRGAVCDGRRLCARRTDRGSRHLLRQVHYLPGGGRGTGWPGGGHGRPSSWLGGEPAGLGVSRPNASRPRRRPARHAAVVPVHPGRGGPRGARDRDHRPVGNRGEALARAARNAVHRRRPQRCRRHGRLRRLGASDQPWRRAGHP